VEGTATFDEFIAYQKGFLIEFGENVRINKDNGHILLDGVDIDKTVSEVKKILAGIDPDNFGDLDMDNKDLGEFGLSEDDDVTVPPIFDGALVDGLFEQQMNQVILGTAFFNTKIF